ncbi:hypothetical protein [uncultured Sphingomonas sp.]
MASIDAHLRIPELVIDQRIDAKISTGMIASGSAGATSKAVATHKARRGP